MNLGDPDTLQTTEQTPDPIVQPLSPNDVAAIPSVGMRVMIVEDEALIAEVLAEVLEDMGFAVCSIEATEAGAVAAADRCNPDLMIVDARLRSGSGTRAMEQILAKRFVPHIFVSGDELSTKELHHRAIVLQKPFLETALTRAIQCALAGGATVAASAR